MKIAKNLTDLIGNTPTIRLNALTGKDDATIFAKLEAYNPGVGTAIVILFILIGLGISTVYFLHRAFKEQREY